MEINYNRIAAPGDGVFAVAMTPLALEIHAGESADRVSPIDEAHR